MGSALAHYEGIKAFSETDQTDDRKAITVPTLVMQGDDDQIVPYKDAALLQAKLLEHGTLKILPRLPSRHDDHSCRHDQCGPPGLYPKLNPCGVALRARESSFVETELLDYFFESRYVFQHSYTCRNT